MDCSPPALLPMGFSRQEHWSGLPCPALVSLPDTGTECMVFTSPALAGKFFTTELHGKPLVYLVTS